MNYVLHISLCGFLIVLAVAVWLYRKWLEDHCDTLLHLHNDSHDSSLVSMQGSMCKRLEGLGKVRTALVVAAVVYALAIGAMAIFGAWNTPNVS